MKVVEFKNLVAGFILTLGSIAKGKVNSDFLSETPTFFPFSYNPFQNTIFLSILNHPFKSYWVFYDHHFSNIY